MSRTRRYIKPVIVEAGGEIYVIYLGKPGRPRVYRRVGTTERRVADDDPALAEIARAMKAGVEERKRAEAETEAHRKTMRYRVLRWWGRVLARIRGAWSSGIDATLRGPEATKGPVED